MVSFLHMQPTVWRSLYLCLIFSKDSDSSFVSFSETMISGFSRIYLGVHYPFDVLIGFFIGAFFAYLAQFIFKKQVLFKQAN